MSDVKRDLLTYKKKDLVSITMTWQMKIRS